ncbi:MAG: hypothetical protein ABJA85_06165 [Bacteroidota bacterium]
MAKFTAMSYSGGIGNKKRSIGELIRRLRDTISEGEIQGKGLM